MLLGLSYASVSLDDIERNTNVAGQVTSGSSDGYAAGGLFEARYKVSQSDALNIALLGRAHGSYIELDGYTETGATGLNQIVEDRTLAPFYAELGGELTGNSGFNWRLEGVYVDAIEGPDQEVTTALVTVANVARTINTEADESGYGRFTGSALLDLGMVGLEVGGQVTAGRDDGDGYGAFVRAARTF